MTSGRMSRKSSNDILEDDNDSDTLLLEAALAAAMGEGSNKVAEVGDEPIRTIDDALKQS